MKKNTISGNYFYADTFIHNSNPILKLIVVLFTVGLVFAQSSTINLLYIMLFAIVLSACASVKPRFYLNLLKKTKYFMFFAIFTGFLKHSYPYYYKFLCFTISKDNLLFSAHFSLQIIITVLLFSTFAVSTSITSLINASTRLQNIYLFRQIRLKDFLFILMLSLNFIPIILEEYDKAKETLPVKASTRKAYLSVIPLVFVSTLKRAETLSLSIDSKCYNMPEAFFEKEN